MTTYQLHPFTMQLRRFVSGIFACLALAQLSLGSVVTRCPAPHAKLHVAMTAHTHEAHHANGPAATDAEQQSGDHGTSCGQMAQSECARMLSCSVTMDSPVPTTLTALQHDDLIVSRHLGAPLALVRAPEPPPPRA
jgi:hypothetical protein